MGLDQFYNPYSTRFDPNKFDIFIDCYLDPLWPAQTWPNLLNYHPYSLVISFVFIHFSHNNQIIYNFKCLDTMSWAHSLRNVYCLFRIEVSKYAFVWNELSFENCYPSPYNLTSILLICKVILYHFNGLLWLSSHTILFFFIN